MKSAFLAWCISVFAFLPVGVSAIGPAPDELIRQLSDDVLEILLADESLRTGETTRVVGLIEQKILPHFNFRRMTMRAVVRDWRDASPGQQKRLMDAFYGILVRTYSNALTHYRDQAVWVRPLRMSPSDKTVRVQTEIRQSGDQPVTVDYVLEQRADGWKVFDIVVAGVSLVSNYRGTFAQEMRVGGIDGLIDSLESKGREVTQPSGQS